MVLKAVSAGIIINLHGYRETQKCKNGAIVRARGGDTAMKAMGMRDTSPSC